MPELSCDEAAFPDFMRAIELFGAGIALLTAAGLVIVLCWNVELLRLIAWLGAGGTMLILGALIVLLLRWIADMKQKW